MSRRQSLTRSKSSHHFTKHAISHPFNSFRQFMMRGGIRL